MPISMSKTIGYSVEATGVESTQDLCIAPLSWRGDDGADFQLGWLIERTEDAIALLTRGEITVEEGAKIHVANSTPTATCPDSTSARVSRIRHIHADLFLIAAQL